MRRTLPLVLTLAACAEVEPPPFCATATPLKQPLFGDLHVHTARSLDAYLQGTRVTPDEAYAFAQGAEVGLPPLDDDGGPTRTLQLSRPLDFAAVTDHAEFLGTVALCTTPGSAAYDSSDCEGFRERPDLAFITINAGTAAPIDSAKYPDLCGGGADDCLTAGLDVWQEIRDAAAAATDPTDACTFSGLVGYEWSGGPNTKNIHRNVIFRSDVVPDLPASYFDVPDPRDLWATLKADCKDVEDCDVLAIPHNANLSDGTMWGVPGGTLTFEPTKADARLQQALEPAVEIMQHKGDGECFPGSPVADEWCDFEKLPYATLSGTNLGVPGTPKHQDFVRDILGEGLRYTKSLGVNPYRYGILASTDTHRGTPGAVDEKTYPGHGGAGVNHREEVEPIVDDPWLNPGGLAVVWAVENRPEAIFDAIQRGETYGTSGPRLELRLFAGDDVPTDLCGADFDERGMAAGVPMGGSLPDGTTQPTFAIRAAADLGSPRGDVGLERLQLVKGWLDGDTPKVEVIDLVVDGDTDIDPESCERATSTPAALCATWTDEDYDPEVPTFYYARVLENPTCRWFGHACLDGEVDDARCDDPTFPKWSQERAWSSPVWGPGTGAIE